MEQHKSPIYSAHFEKAPLPPDSPPPPATPSPYILFNYMVCGAGQTIFSNPASFEFVLYNCGIARDYGAHAGLEKREIPQPRPIYPSPILVLCVNPKMEFIIFHHQYSITQHHTTLYSANPPSTNLVRRPFRNDKIWCPLLLSIPCSCEYTWEGIIPPPHYYLLLYPPPSPHFI